MINYITFDDSGSKDILSLKNADFNVLNLENEEMSKRLSALLKTEFYPNVYELSKGLKYYLYRDVYSGYIREKVVIEKGSVLTLDKDKISKLKVNHIVLNPDLLNIPKGIEKDKIIDNSLEDAKLVFLAGRGIGSKENYLKLKEVAKKYRAEVGCTRPVCMNNWESYDKFVGISGHSLNADLLVTFGVSGSNPLINGILNCKKVISINNDKNALIFNYSDYRVVDDVMKVIKEM